MEVKCGICNFSVPGTGVFAPRIVSEMGLDGMSIEYGSYQHGFPLSQRKLQDLYLEAREKYGIEYPNIGCSDGDNVSFHARPGDPMDAVVNEEAFGAVDAAAYMGIPLVFFSNFNASFMATEEDMEVAAKRYRAICDRAGEKGISIGCENPNSAEQQKRLVEMVDRPNFRIFYDTCNHACMTEYDPMEILKGVYPYLSDNLHVKDGTKGFGASALLGTGTTRFFEQIDFLKEKNYKGWLIIENLYELLPMRELNPDYYEMMAEDIRTLKKVAGR